MKKRLCFILALVLVFSLASATAITASAVQTFNIWVAGEQVTVLNRNDVLGDGTVSYDAGTNTLTLKDAKIINLDDEVENGHAIVVRQELTITGTGSIRAVEDGISAYAPLTIRDATLTIRTQEDCPIHTGYDLTIRNSDLTLSTEKGFGIDVYTAASGESKSETLIEGSKIAVKADAELSSGIEADKLTIRNSEVSVEAGQEGIYVHGSSFLVEDSKVTAQALGGILLFNSDFKIRNSEITAKGITGKGIRANDALVIEGERTVVTMDSEEDYAVFAQKGIEIDSALVIQEPAGGKLDSKKQTIMEDNEVVKAMHVVIRGKEKPVVNPFTDVKESDYFYDAVLWAVGEKITAGTSAKTFSPNEDCTRAQVVTFLWRAAGSPDPMTTTNPFQDVREKDYFYKAVLWAVENGITSGTSKTKFSPGEACTRVQVVTFLWRYEKQVEPKSSSNPFKDVKDNAYYYKAVLWAVENGVTSGTSKTKFSPDATCTRGQIVTFLYRDIAKK